MIYLDYAATTPMSDGAMETWMKASHSYFGNSSSLHEAGNNAHELIKTCKERFSSMAGCPPDRIFFTSGGSESNLLALESLYLANKHRGNHVITSSIEHPSVHSFFNRLEKKGVEVTYLPVGPSGLLQLEEVKQAVRPDTFLASIQHVNSEIGVIQPLRQLGEWFKGQGIVFHSDCVQSFGKIPFHLPSLNVDAASVSSHKLNGPKGVGAVFLSKDTEWESVYPLTTHQHGFRPGTLNTPGIAAFTHAAAEHYDRLQEEWAAAWHKRELFIQALSSLGARLTVEGSPSKEEQSPWIAGLAIHGVQGQYMLLSLDRFQICISTGSACQSGKLDSSSVMQAIYQSEQERLRFFRVSFGKNTTMEELLLAADKILQIAEE
ncbi:IscS subfamily cysteine desulfurase [Salipaludibacillus sp. CUR1]|uniref:IscS subfamily cysteine desulfurase n=1 Tax=Salipaludibacillus sp. CUR1 TaxID=2820003 RepID=UPI001E450607|nr:IscS subfamily cysteine desulfurase [Salipaludibacillus sp. CUR1]MCE7793689.1 IscS subfamily cysteine desulfurase [Salipaludibacillus sp. CUR1]